MSELLFFLWPKNIPAVLAGFRRGRGTRDQIVNTHWTMEKVGEFQKNVHDKLWKILKEMGISDHLTCLPRNLYSGQEATVRTGHGTMD